MNHTFSENKLSNPVIKLPTPKVKIRQIKFNDIPSLRVPNYRQIMDLFLEYIEECHLQDPFQRTKIRLDPVVKTVFKAQLDGDRQVIQVQELPSLVNLFITSHQLGGRKIN